MNDLESNPEYLALLWGVLKTPADDAPRLILSDWLEENGLEERAKFIRWQVKNKDATFRQDDAVSEIQIEMPLCVEQSIINRGFIREIRLTCAEFMGGFCELCDGEGERPVLAHGAGKISQDNPLVADCELCQGIRHIEGVARELFETHPITRVTFLDKRPSESFGLWHWNSGAISRGEDSLPNEIFFLLDGNYEPSPLTGYYSFCYPTEAAALAALCDAAVSYGRELVGLPALKA